MKLEIKQCALNNRSVCDFDAGKLEKAPRLKATSTLEKEIDAEVLILSLNTSGTPQEKSSWAQSDTLNLGWFVQHPSVCPQYVQISVHTCGISDYHKCRSS